MKKIILVLLLITVIPAALSASKDAVDYGSAGQIEVRAGLSVSSRLYSDIKSIYTSINGGANYFLINNFYLGLNPSIGVGYFDIDNGFNDYSRFHVTSGLAFTFGYIYPLTKNIYFDLSSDLRMYYIFACKSNDNNQHIYGFSPGVQTSVKFKLNRILIHLIASHNFISYSNGESFPSGEKMGWQHSYYELSIGIGASYSYIL